MWSSSSSVRDNWERLVAAVIKREQIWQLCHQDSRSPSISTVSSCDDFTQGIHSFSINNLEPFSIPSSPEFFQRNRLVSQVIGNNASSRPIFWKLFSAWYRRRKPMNQQFFDVPAELSPWLGPALKRFSFRELQIATGNFSNRNIVKRGECWEVYKGRLVDGALVAVKRLKEERTRSSDLQFQREVEMFSMAVHRNILRLFGFCMSPTERLLVYPYMPNGNLAYHLRERPSNEPPLDWPMRKRIAVGSARGLLYLHDHCDPKIIHRNVKASNIQLDLEFEAAIADFSLAELMDYKDSHVTSDVRGTVGHIAPECLSTGEISDKTDVFGYGIMLLELITGQRAYDRCRLVNDEDVVLLDWVKGLLKEKNLEMLVDPTLQHINVVTEVEELIQIALLCQDGRGAEIAGRRWLGREVGRME